LKSILQVTTSIGEEIDAAMVEGAKSWRRQRLWSTEFFWKWCSFHFPPWLWWLQLKEKNEKNKRKKKMTKLTICKMCVRQKCVKKTFMFSHSIQNRYYVIIPNCATRRSEWCNAMRIKEDVQTLVKIK
jgi:hypothetical protein